MRPMERPAIAVEGLVKRFGTVEALKGIDFEVPPASIFGLLGPNGAGKTTAIRILATILKPDAGHAEVLGYDVARNPDAVRHLIGLAGQNAAVDPNLTGRENLRLIGKLAQLASSVTKRRADELLERFDLVAAGDRPIKTYSGGMRRRLDVAAALVGRPPVIFLDEPTTGLDIQSRTELWAVIRELVAEGSTVLLTTQYLEEADQLADRIAVVHAGLVVANDTAAALKAKLGNSVIEVTLHSEEEAARAQGLLARLVAARPEREASRVRLSTPDAPKVLTQVLRALDASGMPAAGLTVREPSLDDVFLALTGKHVGTEVAATESKKHRRGKAPAPLSQAAEVVDEIIEDLELGDEAAMDEIDDWPMVFEAGFQDSGVKTLDRVLAELPYKAGSGAVVENLEEVAEAALAHYGNGAGHVDLSPLAGYLTLEQRFGRISTSTSPDQAAALLMGAAYANASGLLRASRRPNGEVKDFAQGAVKILLDGISETESRIRQ
jgi:ABC-2 type transport system ATP-binding protein